MKKFTYEAKDSTSNKIIKATVQADTEHAAAKLLIDQGFAPLDIKEVKQETPIETTKESAQAFLDLAKGQGKVIEND